MFKTRYIILSVFFTIIILFSYSLYRFEKYNYSYVFLVTFNLLLFLFLLRLYKFYYDILKLLKKDNVYIKNTVISFFADPNKEFIRYKYTFKKKVSLLEKKLNQEKKKYSQLLNSIPLPLALVNEHSFVLHANSFTSKIFSNSFEGSYLHHYFRDPKLKTTIDNISNYKQEADLKIKNETNNSTLIYNVKIKPILLEDDKILYYLFIFTDQTSVSKSLEERNDFLANASHELKTPLTNILGIAEILANDQNALVTNKKFADNLLLNSRKMQSLVESLLDLSKVEINRNIISYKTQDIFNLVRNSLNNYININSNNSNVKLINKLSNKTGKIITNEKEFKLILNNLLDNSFKFGATSVNINLLNINNKIIIEIQDNGIGIDNADLIRVTERFYRTKEANNIPGNGLGLAIVNEILKNNSAEIKISSKLKKGTTVSCIFERA